MNKKTIIRILIVLIIITALASIVCFLCMPVSWKRLYLVSGGGVIVFNFLISLFLVYKNFK